MIGAKSLLPDFERAMVQQFALTGPVRLGEHRRKVAQNQRDVGVVWTQGLLPYPKSAPKERLGLPAQSRSCS